MLQFNEPYIDILQGNRICLCLQNYFFPDSSGFRYWAIHFLCCFAFVFYAKMLTHQMQNIKIAIFEIALAHLKVFDSHQIWKHCQVAKSYSVLLHFLSARGFSVLIA